MKTLKGRSPSRSTVRPTSPSISLADSGRTGGSRHIWLLETLLPFLLVFAGHVAPIEHRWNQHGLGDDNIKGSCHDLHPSLVSLLHWSGSGKPWLRLNSNPPCELDEQWHATIYVDTRKGNDFFFFFFLFFFFFFPDFSYFF